jgi:acyl dehydratase
MVFAGDTLYAESTVLSKREFEVTVLSRPGAVPVDPVMAGSTDCQTLTEID